MVLVWHIYQGVMAARADRLTNRYYTHWRSIPREGWTDINERMPGKEDGDAWGCVLTYHRHDGYKVIAWHQLNWDHNYMRWTRLPDKPR